MPTARAQGVQAGGFGFVLFFFTFGYFVLGRWVGKPTPAGGILVYGTPYGAHAYG